MKKMIRTLIYILICWSIGISSVAAQVRVTATLDSTRMLIGDQMNLKLEASYPVGTTISDVDLTVLEAAENIEVISTQASWDTTTIAGETTVRRNIVFTIFETGSFFIPPIPFSFPKNGTTSSVSTNELLINVADVVPEGPAESAVDTVAIAPIKPIYREAMTFEDVAPLLLAFLLIGVIGGLIYFLYRRAQNKKNPPKEKVIIIEPAHIIAQRKLKALKAQQLWQNGSIKEYQSQLTFIVREYLENRYGISALESTTYEILGDLKPIRLSDEWKGKLREMLELADLVKFAKASPPIEAHDRLMGYAEKFVARTKLNVESVTSIGQASSVVGNTVSVVNNSSPLPVQYADFVRRFFANLIDFMLLISIYLIIGEIFANFFVEPLFETYINLSIAGYLPGDGGLFYIFLFVFSILVYLLLACVYFGYMESKKGYTLGKKILGIRVEDYEGNNIKLSRGIIRTIAKLLSSIFFSIPYFSYFFSEKKQTVHDMLAKSIVVKKKK